MADRTCTLDGCDRKHIARGLCSRHYNAAHRTPNPVASYTCPTCESTFTKERARAKRYANVFCSLICRDLHGLERTNGDPFSAARRLHKSKQPSEPQAARTRIYPTSCGECGCSFIGRAQASAYCGEACRNRVRNRRKGHRHAIRRIEIFERDGYACWMCGCQCDPCAKVPTPNAPTVDHITPRSLGGDDDASNLATACFTCNTRRGNRWVIPAPPQHPPIAA